MGTNTVELFSLDLILVPVERVFISTDLLTVH
jgi:hypothetical protein